jgi:ribosomal protein S18 acetylase RimI-like enzyme
MDIRFLASEDANEWSRLRLRSLAEDPEAFSSSVQEHNALPLAEIKKRLGSTAEDSFVVGAFENRTLVGMAGFVREKGPKTRHKGFVWGVYVAPEYRGHGLARKIFAKLFDRVRNIEGLEQVTITVASTQAAAIHLYRSLGFEQFGIEPRALKVAGRTIDEHYMVLVLK